MILSFHQFYQSFMVNWQNRIRLWHLTLLYKSKSKNPYCFYQAAEQERSTFVSYLLPLLSEYSLHPQLSDSQSIVSNVKVRSIILSLLSGLVILFCTSDLLDCLSWTTIYCRIVVWVVALHFGWKSFNFTAFEIRKSKT